LHSRLFPFLIICLAASLVHKNAPFKFTSITSSLSSCIFFDSPPIPALLTRTSILPNCLTVLPIRDIQTDSLDISPGVQTTFPPSSLYFEISSTACFSSYSFLALITTEYPVLANSLAIAFPMPLLEPVTIATLPLLSL
jgi:hypothetical protein